MQHLKAGALILVLIGASGLAFSAWRRGVEARVSVAASGSISDTQVRSESPPAPWTFAPSPTMTPRLIATWATHVAGYTVCISGLRPQMEGRGSSSRLSFDPRTGAGGYTLTAQVLSEDDSVPRAALDVYSLEARDDLGAIYRFEDRIPGTAAPLPLQGGYGYAIPIRSPNPNASYLRYVKGEIQLQNGARKSFRISRIPLPLPHVSRLFGRMNPRTVSGALASRDPDSLVVLQGDEAEAAVKSSRQRQTGALPAPQRLIFASGVKAGFGVPTPSSTDRLTVRAALGPLGVIEIEMQSGDRTWMGRVWDGDTLFVMLPGSDERRSAAAIRFTRDAFPAGDAPAPPPAFPPDPGQPGGSIESRVIIGKRPFGRGNAEIRMRQMRSNGWSETRVTYSPVEEDGGICITNLAPGTYSISIPIKSLMALIPGGLSSPTLEAYLKARFGVSKGSWTGHSAQRVEVQAGRRMRIPDLRFAPVD